MQPLLEPRTVTWTLLHVSSYHGDVEVVQLLFRHNSNAGTRNRHGTTDVAALGIDIDQRPSESCQAPPECHDDTVLEDTTHSLA